MLRVVIAGQDELDNARLAKLLVAHPGVAVVGSTSDGLTALDLVWERRPNVVIVGLLGPPLGGGVLLRLTRDALPGALLVVLADPHQELWPLPQEATAYLTHDAFGSFRLVPLTHPTAHGSRASGHRP